MTFCIFSSRPKHIKFPVKHHFVSKISPNGLRMPLASFICKGVIHMAFKHTFEAYSMESKLKTEFGSTSSFIIIRYYNSWVLGAPTSSIVNSYSKTRNELIAVSGFGSTFYSLLWNRCNLLLFAGIRRQIRRTVHPRDPRERSLFVECKQV